MWWKVRCRSRNSRQSFSSIKLPSVHAKMKNVLLCALIVLSGISESGVNGFFFRWLASPTRSLNNGEPFKHMSFLSRRSANFFPTNSNYANPLPESEPTARGFETSSTSRTDRPRGLSFLSYLMRQLTRHRSFENLQDSSQPPSSSPLVQSSMPVNPPKMLEMIQNASETANKTDETILQAFNLVMPASNISRLSKSYVPNEEPPNSVSVTDEKKTVTNGSALALEDDDSDLAQGTPSEITVDQHSTQTSLTTSSSKVTTEITMSTYMDRSNKVINTSAQTAPLSIFGEYDEFDTGPDDPANNSSTTRLGTKSTPFSVVSFDTEHLDLPPIFVDNSDFTDEESKVEESKTENESSSSIATTSVTTSTNSPSPSQQQSSSSPQPTVPTTSVSSEPVAATTVKDLEIAGAPTIPTTANTSSPAVNITTASSSISIKVLEDSDTGESNEFGDLAPFPFPDGSSEEIEEPDAGGAASESKPGQETTATATRPSSSSTSTTTTTTTTETPSALTQAPTINIPQELILPVSLKTSTTPSSALKTITTTPSPVVSDHPQGNLEFQPVYSPVVVPTLVDKSVRNNNKNGIRPTASIPVARPPPQLNLIPNNPRPQASDSFLYTATPAPAPGIKQGRGQNEFNVEDTQTSYSADLSGIQQLLQSLVGIVRRVNPSLLGQRTGGSGSGEPNVFNINIGTINVNSGQNSRVIYNGNYGLLNPGEEGNRIQGQVRPGSFLPSNPSLANSEAQFSMVKANSQANVDGATTNMFNPFGSESDLKAVTEGNNNPDQSPDLVVISSSVNPKMSNSNRRPVKAQAEGPPLPLEPPFDEFEDVAEFPALSRRINEWSVGD